MASANSLTRIQEVYIAYYGRPADPAGQLFWCLRLDDAGGDLTQVIDAFGNSAEFDSRFGDFTDEELIDNLFQQAFGRDADDAGMAFYLELLETGEASLADIALRILDGAQNEDAQTIANKIEVADAFTDRVAAAQARYDSDAKADAARDLLAEVTDDPATVDPAIEASYTLIASFGSDDVVAPSATSSNPLDDALDVAVDGEISLTFDEPVEAGSGNIELIDTGDGNDTRVISVDDSQVSFDGSRMILTLTSPLEESTTYAVQIDFGAIVDAAGNGYAGINDLDTFNFTTTEPVVIPGPVLVSTVPTDDFTDFPVTANLTLRFDRDIEAGVGNLLLVDDTDGTDTRTIAVTDSQVFIQGNSLRISLEPILRGDKQYHLEVPAGAVVDLAGDPWAGISDPTELNFSTEPAPDFEAPLAVSTTPTDNDQTTEVTSDIVIEFDEPVFPGAGMLQLIDTDDGSDTRTFDISDPQVLVTGNQLQVNPVTELDPSTNYAVLVDMGYVRDASFNDFAGIDNSSVFNFRTAGGFIFTGTAGTDIFTGAELNDLFQMGTNLSSQDMLDGAGGVDTLTFSGSQASDFDNVVNIEILIAGDVGTTITTVNSLVAQGGTLTLDASALGPGRQLNFDGSAETDGDFVILSGAENDQITAGRGDDTIDGGGGNDTIIFGSWLTAADTVDGGAGTDSLQVDGAQQDDLDGVSNVERLVLGSLNAEIIAPDSLVAEGAIFTIDASGVGSGVLIEFNGSAETDGTFTFLGGASADNLVGGDGDDIFDMGDGLTPADILNGGPGNDTLLLDGPSDGDLVNVRNMEQIVLGPANATLKINDKFLAMGSTATIDGSALTAGLVLSFDGRAETDGNYNVIGGAGNDVLQFGAGTDTVNAGPGNDSITMGENMTALDEINGGTGTDTLFITGLEADGLDNVLNVEGVFLADATTTITTLDSLVASLATLSVNGTALSVGQVLTFDGSAETNGGFVVSGGADGDTLIGGGQADQLNGGGGPDILEGGGGIDLIRVGDGSDIVVVGDGNLRASDRDSVQNFSIGDDKIRIDALIVNGGSGDIRDGLIGTEYKNTGANPGGYTMGGDFLVLDLGFEFDADIELTTGTTLASLLSAAGAADDATSDPTMLTPATITGLNPQDEFLLIAYQNSDAYFYLVKEQDGNSTITAGGSDTIELVGIYTDIAVAAFTASDFIA
jgi:methionine-rich copper-binding protein CopC